MRSPPVRALPRAAEAVGVVPWSRQARFTRSVVRQAKPMTFAFSLRTRMRVSDIL
jgi:hypothetical protein